jgi:hypothetical protein
LFDIQQTRRSYPRREAGTTPPNPYEEAPGRSPGHQGIQEEPSEGYYDVRGAEPDYDVRRVVGVPEPEILKAMGIVLVIGLVNAAVNFCLSLGLGGAGGAGPRARGADPTGGLLAGLISLPIDFLIGSALLSAMLPTTFGKAALVYLIQLALSLVIIGGIVLLFLLAILVTGAKGFRF